MKSTCALQSTPWLHGLLAGAFYLLCGWLAVAAVNAKELTTLRGHDGWIAAVAFSPDGKRLATAGGEGAVKLWDTSTWKQTITLEGHEDAVAAVAFTLDSQSLVSAGLDGKLRLVDSTFPTQPGAKVARAVPLLCVAVSRAQQIAVGKMDGALFLISLDASPFQSRIINGHKSWVNSAAFSSDGATLATGSSDGTVILWDARRGNQRATFDAEAGEIRSVAWAPNGSLLAAGTRYGTVPIWDMKTKELVKTLKLGGGEVWAVAFSPSGKLLAAVDGDWKKPSEVRLFDTSTWRQVGSLKHTGEILCLAFSPTEPILAAGSWDKIIKVWNTKDLLDR